MQDTQNSGHSADPSQDRDNPFTDLTREQIIDRLIEERSTVHSLRHELTKAVKLIASQQQRLETLKSALERTPEGYIECVTDKLTGILIGDTERGAPHWLVKVHPMNQEDIAA